MNPKDMVKLLSSKLTKEEFNQLAIMIDGDPPTGPFWEAIQDQNMQLNPESYVDKFSKEEVDFILGEEKIK